MRSYLKITILDLKASLRKLLYGFGEEIVVFLCGGVLASLFFYMLHDLLYKQMLELSQVSQKQIQDFLAILLAVFCGFIGSSFIFSDLFKDKNLLKWSSEKGEDKRELFWFIFFSGSIKAALLLFIYLLLNQIIFSLMSFKDHIILGFVFIFSGSIEYFFLSMQRKYQKLLSFQKLKLKSFFPKKIASQKTALFFWFFREIFRLHLMSIIILLTFIIGLFFIAFFAHYKAPPSLIFFSSYGTSLFAAYYLSYSFAFLLKNSWIEKQAAITHEAYLKTIEEICLSIYLILSGVLFFWVCLNQQEGFSFEALRIALASTVSCQLIPAVFFQIAPKKHLIVFMSTFLLSLFVGTGIFVSWFGLLALPVVFSYGRSSQKDRFYKILALD